MKSIIVVHVITFTNSRKNMAASVGRHKLAGSPDVTSKERGFRKIYNGGLWTELNQYMRPAKKP